MEWSQKFQLMNKTPMHHLRILPSKISLLPIKMELTSALLQCLRPDLPPLPTLLAPNDMAQWAVHAPKFQVRYAPGKAVPVLQPLRTPNQNRTMEILISKPDIEVLWTVTGS